MSESIITRDNAKKMVEKYQSAPSGSNNPNTGEMQPITNFVHFTVAEIFELMTLNGIVKEADTIGEILQSKNKFGLKIYFAQHVDADDCPNNDTNYVGSNTTVIVNTVEKNSVWYDMPEKNSGISEIAEFATETSGKALDKGTKCPPSCGVFENTL